MKDLKIPLSGKSISYPEAKEGERPLGACAVPQTRVRVRKETRKKRCHEERRIGSVR